ncbi:MAG: HEPN domain-containing protein [Phycisphaerales bacterium]|nr:HEPN domain-containing protein [Phycisphaerales bacterium]
MSTWTQLAEESLHAAKTCHERGCYRSAVSRAYYTAYAMIAAWLERAGASFGRENPSHAQVESMLQASLARRRRNSDATRDMVRRLRNLRRFRLVSDYSPAGYIDKEIARACLRDASILTLALSEGRV